MSAESIVVECTSCGKKFRGAAKLAGRSVKCPGCGAVIQVPGTSAVQPHVSAAVAAAPTSEWPPQDNSESPPPDLAGAAAYEAAPIPSPAYAPPAGVQVSAPFAPAAARKPVNTKLLIIIGASVVGVAAIGLVLYLFVFVSAERQLIGTWQAKPAVNDPYFSLEVTFQKDGKYVVVTTFRSLSRTEPGTWELNEKKLTTRSDASSRIGVLAGRDPKVQVMEIVELNSKTLKVRPESYQDVGIREFTRK